MAITDDEIRAALKAAPPHMRTMLRNLFEYPSERNTCFAHGYVTAMEDAGLLYACMTYRTIINNAPLLPWVKRELKEQS